MEVLSLIKNAVQNAVRDAFDHELELDAIKLTATKKEFEGDFTFVVFPLVKNLRQGPEQIAVAIGDKLKEGSEYIDDYNVVKGFLNLELSNPFWLRSLSQIRGEDFMMAEKHGKKMMVEFSSPNTNKPLHLGHIRNILLGWSMAQIAENRGYDVIKTQIINDRGIAVCKSMMAWKLFSDGATPETTGKKGDHFVGDYYVKFDKAIQKEYADWQANEGIEFYNSNKKEDESQEAFFKRYKNQYFNDNSKLGRDTKDMLIRWENGDPETVELWKMMNSWVYSGFDQTYKELGVEFDTINYESETYLLGKESVEKGLSDGVFFKKDDGSVWIDLEDVKMDKKIVLRSDGTSVYMTQDIGTAQMRYKEHGIDSMVYVVGDEQDYHFKVLFEILKRLGEPYADHLHHLSYGMVDLPTGKMKSREGTVVDADDLIAEVINEAKQGSSERGGVAHLTDEEQNNIFRKIGLAALKYFIIKINPKKRMVFDPKESVDMQGTTGPYIQNAYVRIRSVIRKAESQGFEKMDYSSGFKSNEQDRAILSMMLSYPEVIDEALLSYDPSVIANFCYALAKAFHRYYHDNILFDPSNLEESSYRIELAETISNVLENAMALLGIEMPDYM